MAEKTLVLGASLNSGRYSHMAIHQLVRSNIDVVAIGKKKGVVAGISIDEKLVPYKGVDTVTLYLNSSNQKQFYGYIIGLKPRRVIFNPGTENPEFYLLLKDNGIQVQQACTLVLLSTNQY
ncbi:CoA-binding protein [Mangrovimonas aestuarii]|uniref:CoA-binding protein n=1 Tax=Mangrovimonas aestuarii TaxID=3018443 RepID=UPI0023787D3C|nr:CoA-binding protein [Mangrovimonas aestuarii]